MCVHACVHFARSPYTLGLLLLIVSVGILQKSKGQNNRCSLTLYDQHAQSLYRLCDTVHHTAPVFARTTVTLTKDTELVFMSVASKGELLAAMIYD